MEQRSRQKRKETKQTEKVEVYYIDRDRAAAVVLGNKDIKRDLETIQKIEANLRSKMGTRLCYLFSCQILQ